MVSNKIISKPAKSPYLQYHFPLFYLILIPNIVFFFDFERWLRTSASHCREYTPSKTCFFLLRVKTSDKHKIMKTTSNMRSPNTVLQIFAGSIFAGSQYLQIPIQPSNPTAICSIDNPRLIFIPFSTQTTLLP